MIPIATLVEDTNGKELDIGFPLSEKDKDQMFRMRLEKLAGIVPTSYAFDEFDNERLHETTYLIAGEAQNPCEVVAALRIVHPRGEFLPLERNFIFPEPDRLKNLEREKGEKVEIDFVVLTDEHEHTVPTDVLFMALLNTALRVSKEKGAKGGYLIADKNIVRTINNGSLNEITDADPNPRSLLAIKISKTSCLGGFLIEDLADTIYQSLKKAGWSWKTK